MCSSEARRRSPASSRYDERGERRGITAPLDMPVDDMRSRARLLPSMRWGIPVFVLTLTTPCCFVLERERARERSAFPSRQ
jgi:hypothetical protein